MHKRIIIVSILFFLANLIFAESNSKSALNVVKRVFGDEVASVFIFTADSSLEGNDAYKIKAEDGKVIVSGNSSISLCRGAYDFLKDYCDGIYTWSGVSVDLEKLKAVDNFDDNGESPFIYRYYFNVVTHGYTTPYWTWERWSQEIDWMAMHGVNMPLLPGATEAILYRTFLNLGFSEDEAKGFFTGPAYFPWNRMGNIAGWNNNMPDSYFQKQVDLTHKILDRLQELGMTPIIPAFAGFVPDSLNKYYPATITKLKWAKFSPENQASLILPSTKQNQELFIKIGNLYVSEWEKEFGVNKYYLSDTFNEMDVPLSSNNAEALRQMNEYGSTIYKSISGANPNAVWTMQGWTFPFHKDHLGRVVWTPERLSSFVSSIPDDKVLFLDLANDYNVYHWFIQPSWVTYSGFFGKSWIYSTIPNMGGKVSYIGVLDFYAKGASEALAYEKKGNLIGYGSAPEGIENNEIIYELIFDAAWDSDAIELDSWIEDYCMQKYGYSGDIMKSAMALLQKSCYGDFTDHPRFEFQFRPSKKSNATAHSSKEFFQAVEKFADASEFCDSQMYQNDLIELTAQYLGLVADNMIKKANWKVGKSRLQAFNDIYTLLCEIDSLLASHPNLQLQRWVSFARAWGDSDEEKAYYESDAKRLITTWGPGVNEYAAKLWSGLVKDYYATRLLSDAQARRDLKKFYILEWEEDWIMSVWRNTSKEYTNPIQASKNLIKKYEKYVY
ncbi:MAG: alpha-N-acetylglucosaminidase C-terminal domain-containing protein [Spirochaetales bacterium]|nr:alpha-N-acetylglucosaminidase C-terminal domain-containing protein [Spirochaetales bacterium]